MSRNNQHVNVLLEHVKGVVVPAITNVRVVSYVLVAVVFVGGAGIWMPWVREDQIATWLPGSTVFTYSFALLGTIICNRLYFYTKSIKEIKGYFAEDLDKGQLEERFQGHENRSILSAWGMLFGSLVIILITLSYSKYYSSDSYFGWIGLILALCLYFCAAAEDVIEKSSVIDKPEQAAGLVLTTETEVAPLNSDFFGNGSK